MALRARRRRGRDQRRREPENQYERQSRQLLEVYLRRPTARRQPLLFEAYLRSSSSIAASGRQHLYATSRPALFGALLVLAGSSRSRSPASLARRLRAASASARPAAARDRRVRPRSGGASPRPARRRRAGARRRLGSRSAAAAADGGRRPRERARDAATRHARHDARPAHAAGRALPADLHRPAWRAALADVLRRCTLGRRDTEVDVPGDLARRSRPRRCCSAPPRRRCGTTSQHAKAEPREVRSTSTTARRA